MLYKSQLNLPHHEPLFSLAFETVSEINTEPKNHRPPCHYGTVVVVFETEKRDVDVDSIESAPNHLQRL